MLAGLTRVPELAIAESEAAELAKAAATVAAYYPNIAVADKTLAWINLAQVAGLMYGTRIFAIRERRKEQRAERAAKQTGPRADFTTPPRPTPVPADEIDLSAAIINPGSTLPGAIPDEYVPGFNFPGMNGSVAN